MINRNDIISDMHIHTIFSKHAYSTLKENLCEAQNNNMKYIAITDHFYQNGDFIDKKNEIIRMSHASEFKNRDEIKIISGGEFNLNQLLDKDVNVRKIYKNVKWRPIGLHTWFLAPEKVNIEDIPEYFEKAVTSKDIINPTAFCHIERELYKCKGSENNKKVKNALYEIVDIAIQYKLLLEVNELSIINNEVGGISRMKIWLNRAKEKNAMIYLGSDAHFCEQVGNFKNAINLINEIGISKENILNTDENMKLFNNDFVI